MAPGLKPRDREEIIMHLMGEVDLTKGEAMLYLKLLTDGSLPLSAKGRDLSTLQAMGMLILSGDGTRYIPVHPRLAVANHFRTFREKVVRELNERRMRIDRLILELIPLFEAATEKRLRKRSGE
jgi:DNA-binding transcriptional ArsR family regulator